MGFKRKFKITIDEDGSRTAFDPNTPEGQTKIEETGKSGFVVLNDEQQKTHANIELTIRGEKVHVAVNPNGTLVSQTTLHTDRKLPSSQQLDDANPDKYFDSDNHPMIALSNRQMSLLNLSGKDVGTEVTLTNTANGKKVVATFADRALIKPRSELEINPQAAQALGISVDENGHTGTQENFNIEAEGPKSTPSRKHHGKHSHHAKHK